jgi:restriction endonuclease Mrr
VNSYKVGHTYVDTGGSSKDHDQFLRWINIAKSGMRNMDGIRALNYVSKKSDHLPAYVILVSHEIKRAGNPWEDIVDYNSATVYYWGDAKFDLEKHFTEFRGNKRLIQVWETVLENKLDLVPPILHFTKPSKGIIKFTGLCALTDLKYSWFEELGNPVKNLRAELTILDTDEVHISWLHNRAKCTDLKKINHDAPKIWTNYVSGKVQKLDIHRKRILKKERQLPAENSNDAKVLNQLNTLSPKIFEAVVVEIFKQLPHVNHNITRTRLVKDEGFDFYGEFSIPYPLAYKIDFLGEVKRYSRNNGVGPELISRLVARLGRGQFGIFVTTSYYTEQAQHEVLEDEYPIRLYSGIDLVNFLRELRLINNNSIKSEWLQSVIKSIQ